MKRELKDGSLDSLLTSHVDQTLTYQTTNLKFGVMLVLYLSKHHVRTAQRDTSYKIRVGNLMQYGTERGLLIVKVPGRRGTPERSRNLVFERFEIELARHPSSLKEYRSPILRRLYPQPRLSHASTSGNDA